MGLSVSDQSWPVKGVVLRVHCLDPVLALQYYNGSTGTYKYGWYPYVSALTTDLVPIHRDCYQCNQQLMEPSQAGALPFKRSI